MFGVRPRPGRILKTLARLVSRALRHAVRGARPAAALIVVGYLLVPSQFAFLNEVILLERVGPVPCLRALASDQPRFRGRALRALDGADRPRLTSSRSVSGMGAETLGLGARRRRAHLGPAGLRSTSAACCFKRASGSRSLFSRWFASCRTSTGGSGSRAGKSSCGSRPSAAPSRRDCSDLRPLDRHRARLSALGIGSQRTTAADAAPPQA